MFVDAELTMHAAAIISANTSLLVSDPSTAFNPQAAWSSGDCIQLVSALVISRLDYCNAVLAGLPSSTLAPLQRVLHSAAHQVLELSPSDHISAAMHELHWLPILKRIQCNLCLLAQNVRIGRAPKYMSMLHVASADVPSKTALCSSHSGEIDFPSTRPDPGTAPSPSLPLVLRMFCRQN